MPILIQKGTGKPVLVPEESVEYWTALGYKPKPAPKPAPKRAPVKK